MEAGEEDLEVDVAMADMVDMADTAAMAGTVAAFMAAMAVGDMDWGSAVGAGATATLTPMAATIHWIAILWLVRLIHR